MGRMRSKVALVVALCAAQPLISSRAFAEPSAADMESARSLYKEGKKLRDEGKLGAALAKFQAAYALAKTPILGLETGSTSAKLGLLVEARTVLLEVGHIPVAPGESPEAKEARGEAAKLAVELEPRIPSIRVVLSGVPAGSTPVVAVDDVVIPPAAASDPRRVDPGHHVVTAKVGEGPEARVEVDVKESQLVDVPIAVIAPSSSSSAIVEPPPVVVTPSAKNDAKTEARTNPLVWAGFGLGAAGLVAGSITGVIAFSKTSTVKDECPTKTCTPSQQSDIDAAKRFGTISTISFAVAGVGAIVGVVGLLSGGSREPAPSPSANVSWWIGPGSAGVAGAF